MEELRNSRKEVLIAAALAIAIIALAMAINTTGLHYLVGEKKVELEVGLSCLLPK